MVAAGINFSLRVSRARMPGWQMVLSVGPLTAGAIALSVSLNPGVADAGTSVTLYVDGTNGTSATACTRIGVDAGQTIGGGITAATSGAYSVMT